MCVFYSGILYQEQQRYQEAIDSYQRAIQCRPRLTSGCLTPHIHQQISQLRSQNKWGINQGFTSAEINWLTLHT